MSDKFEPSKVVELPTVDELMDENPIDSDAVGEAAEAWKDEPPDEEFANILDAEEVED